ncbi:PD40 domain-containing protein [candidate division KSB1 bacterium]|nr:PD40 domain-containing protein [candidate division KSB1 bacterium]
MSVYNLKLLMLISMTLGCCFTGCGHQDSRDTRRIDKIYFLSNREAPPREFDVFSMNVDGSNQVNLTRHISGIRSFSKPSVSHDGKTVLFVTDYGSKKTIQALNIGDSLTVPLTEIRLNTPRPEFSPDDRYIIFTDRLDTLNQIFIMNRDGAERRKLSQNNFDDSNASFSPDGRTICYQTRLKHTSSIGVMNMDGSKQHILTDDAGNDVSPSFSPDGSHIVFASDRNGTMDIFLLKVSGQKMKSLYSNTSHDSDPVLTPDGNYVVFGSNIRGKKFRDMVLLNIETGDINLLSQTANMLNQHPLIMPDGKSVLFESTNFQRSDIMKVELENLKLINLTNNPGWNQMPVY